MTDNTTSKTEDTEFYTHEDWEHGYPCPDCGNECMDVIQVSAEKYQHHDGEMEHIDYSPYREDLKITCADCDTVLLRHPAMHKLKSV